MTVCYKGHLTAQWITRVAHLQEPTQHRLPDSLAHQRALLGLRVSYSSQGRANDQYRLQEVASDRDKATGALRWKIFRLRVHLKRQHDL